MRVGIVTLHSGFNEGAVLQAYALCDTLNRTIEVDAEVVDIRYPGKSEVYGAPGDDRERALDFAARTWLRTSPTSFEYGHSRDYFRYLESRYDALVTGSDVVWQLRYKRRLRRLLGQGVFPRQSYPFYPAFPNAYWLSGCSGLSKFAYAASIGSFDWKTAPSRDLAAMGDSLHRFKAIGVRDERTLEFVRTVCPGFDGPLSLTPDPTLLLPEDAFNDDDDAVMTRLSCAGIDLNDKKVGVVCRSTNGVPQVAKDLADRGWQVISLTATSGASGVNMAQSGLSPAEWTRAIAAMDLVITERMHATIFCIKHGVPFVVIDPNNEVAGEQTKVSSLLRMLGLSRFRISLSKLSAESLSAMVSDATEVGAVDWKSVRSRLDELRVRGLEFLANCMPRTVVE